MKHLWTDGPRLLATLLILSACGSGRTSTERDDGERDARDGRELETCAADVLGPPRECSGISACRVRVDGGALVCRCLRVAPNSFNWRCDPEGSCPSSHPGETYCGDDQTLTCQYPEVNRMCACVDFRFVCSDIPRP